VDKDDDYQPGEKLASLRWSWVWFILFLPLLVAGVGIWEWWLKFLHR
jgi:hypothetical protein